MITDRSKRRRRLFFFPALLVTWATLAIAVDAEDVKCGSIEQIELRYPPEVDWGKKERDTIALGENPISLSTQQRISESLSASDRRMFAEASAFIDVVKQLAGCSDLKYQCWAITHFDDYSVSSWTPLAGGKPRPLRLLHDSNGLVAPRMYYVFKSLVEQTGNSFKIELNHAIQSDSKRIPHLVVSDEEAASLAMKECRKSRHMSDAFILEENFRHCESWVVGDSRFWLVWLVSQEDVKVGCIETASIAFASCYVRDMGVNDEGVFGWFPVLVFSDGTVDVARVVPKEQ